VPRNVGVNDGVLIPALRYGRKDLVA